MTVAYRLGKILSVCILKIGQIMKRNVIFLLFIILLVSCSGIQMMGGNANYSSDFLEKMDSIQLMFKDGDKQNALNKLIQIRDEELNKDELAKKYNLLGVIYFSTGNVSDAAENFQIAKQNVSGDFSLASQINLNLASSYFKLGKIELCQSTLKSVNLEYFNDKEKEKFYKLNLSVASQLDDSKQIVNSLMFLLKDVKSFQDIDDYQFKELLVDNFRKLPSRQRVQLLDKYEEDRELVAAYLGKQEALNRFYQGDKSGAADVVTWLGNKFKHIEEVAKFVEDYNFRVANFSKINAGAVGVVVPLSQDKVAAGFGKKVLAGVMAALDKEDKNQTIQIHVKDNMDNKFLARKMVQELVMKHHVSAIIGGLYPELAKEEYLEARKYGVLYISLAEVYLPREEKTHLLIEIPGSVESQINTVIQPKALDFFGKNLAVLYPWSDGGKSYINELWGIHNAGKIKLTSINNYEQAKKKRSESKYIDYREPVKQLLSLKYPRERKEELEVWKEIRNSQEKNVRIINELPPIIDFDWVFIPSVPSEAIQIIPTFPYFDAKNIKFVGGPSWINKTLREEQSNLGGRLFSIGNDTQDIGMDFLKKYKQETGHYPKLLDTRAYESMLIVRSILEGQKFSERDELEKRVLELSAVKGITSNWQLLNGLWLKEMDILKVSKKGFTKLEI